MSGVHDPGGAVGALNQCVMSLYGATRMLARRELGAAQILPALADLRAGLTGVDVVVQHLLHELEAAASGTVMAEAVKVLSLAMQATLDDTRDAFVGDGKLTARRRLALERESTRLGGAVQAMTGLLGVAHAALSPRPIVLTLADLLRGTWAPRLAFVAGRIEVCVELAGAPQFQGDPRVLWAMLERSLSELAHLGEGTVFALVSGEPPEIRVGDVGPLPRKSIVRVRVPLGPRAPIEDTVLDAIAKHHGVDRERLSSEQRIALAVA